MKLHGKGEGKFMIVGNVWNGTQTAESHTSVHQLRPPAAEVSRLCSYAAPPGILGRIMQLFSVQHQSTDVFAIGHGATGSLLRKAMQCNWKLWNVLGNRTRVDIRIYFYDTIRIYDSEQNQALSWFSYQYVIASCYHMLQIAKAVFRHELQEMPATREGARGCRLTITVPKKA